MNKLNLINKEFLFHVVNNQYGKKDCKYFALYLSDNSIQIFENMDIELFIKVVDRKYNRDLISFENEDIRIIHYDYARTPMELIQEWEKLKEETEHARVTTT